VDSFISLLGEKTLMNSGTGSRQIQSGDLNPNLQILKETALKNGLSK